MIPVLTLSCVFFDKSYLLKGVLYMEQLISGYCRHLDQARTVMVEEEDGQWQQDCEYPHCGFSGNCTIGARICQLEQEGV